MMHLDANAAIALLNESNVGARARYDEARAAHMPLALSIIVYHELMFGAAASGRRAANEEKVSVFITSGKFAVLAFDEADAREAAEIRAHLRQIGKPIGPYDVLIAAQARRARATLVTANHREFERVPGLLVIDWSV
jgi:tRNA(fMet)-specific endonuclease VapC